MVNAGGPGAPTIWRGAVRVSLAALLVAAAGCGSAVPPPATGVTQAPAPSGSSAPTVPKRLRVLGTNDFHGNLRPHIPEWSGGRPVGGAAALASYFRRAQAEVDAPTVLLDGGDVMQGTPLSNLTFGRSTVEFFNRVGYTAVAIGNHEFDWGADTLAARIRQARFAWLGANIRVKGTDTLPSWSRATHMVTLPGCAAGPPACDSVRVGFVGIVTRTTPIAALPSNVAPFEFEDEAETIDDWVPRLREQGADFVIVVAHEGARCTTPPSEGCGGVMMDAAARLEHPPDLIVGGHVHGLLDVRAGGVPIVQAGQYGTHFSVVDLERHSPDSVAVYVRGLRVAYTDGVEPDAEIARLVSGYAAAIGPVLDRVVATFDQPLVRRGGEHALGNLIADAQRRATGTSVAIMNNGGIRTDVLSGPVRYEDLFRLQPFGNTLVTMDLTGAQLLAAIEHALQGGRAGAHFSGVRVRFRADGQAGPRVVSASLEGGAPIDDDAVYRVVVNNFLAEGGDGFAMLRDGTNVDHTGIVDLEALMDHLDALPSPVPVPTVERMQPVGGGGGN